MGSGGGVGGSWISHESGLEVVFILLFFSLMGSLGFGEGSINLCLSFPLVDSFFCCRR